ncbi:sporadTIGR04255: family protein [Calidithermus terrae]|uniref:SporadTIGR04255: family protein n=1 Tax=Calidithermus terrae TaxID=1408545 RepID=A0A399F1K3_9DEIN|nr:TIGR04255 family protein [Calidithermus terrae]RIH90644.1 sporadTIGR04255: family protein [Calidithermus terrae]
MSELPLQLAVLELRFPGDPEVEVARGRFYQKIRSEFPEVYVPTLEPNQAPALQAYQFATPNRTRTVNVALNSFAYVVQGSEYKSFEVFIKSFRHYFNFFTSEYGSLPGLTRIGLRYINFLPLERNAAGMILYSPLNLPQLSDSPRRNVGVLSESLEGRGLLRVYISSTGADPRMDKVGAELPRDKVILDFDYSFEGTVYYPIPLSDLDEYTQEAHDVTKGFFRKLIAPEYLKEVGVQ